MFDLLSPSVQVKRTGVCNHVDGNENTRAELKKRRIVLCLIYCEVRENSDEPSSLVSLFCCSVQLHWQLMSGHPLTFGVYKYTIASC